MGKPKNRAPALILGPLIPAASFEPNDSSNRRPGETFQSCLDFISDTPENAKHLFLAPRGLCRIVQGPVKPLAGLPQKHRARAALGTVANRDHVVEGLPGELLHQLAPLPSNVDAQLSHDFDCIRVQPAGHGTRAVGLEPLRREMAQQALGHLRAAGVAHAEKQRPLLGCHALVWFSVRATGPGGAGVAISELLRPAEKMSTISDKNKPWAVNSI